jgi:hydrogenase maturation factor
MCRTTVGRVMEVEDGMAVVDLGDMRRTALSLMVPDLAPGDLVLVGLGAVLGRVAPDDEAAFDAIQRPPALPTQVLPAARPTF